MDELQQRIYNVLQTRLMGSGVVGGRSRRRSAGTSNKWISFRRSYLRKHPRASMDRIRQAYYGKRGGEFLEDADIAERKKDVKALKYGLGPEEMQFIKEYYRINPAASASAVKKALKDLNKQYLEPVLSPDERAERYVKSLANRGIRLGGPEAYMPDPEINVYTGEGLRRRRRAPVRRRRL